MKDKIVTIVMLLAAALLGFALSSCEALRGVKASYDGDTGEASILLPPVNIGGGAVTQPGPDK